MSLTSLYYANEAEWKCLPDWACFFLSLGAFDLKPGEWTDDISIALCLAESLIGGED